MKTLLNVGCGHSNISELKGFSSNYWKEIRLDIDEKVNPDIIGNLTDMNLVETASIDAIYSAYNIDHIYAHEVPIAFREFYRVLKDDGIVVLRCPDIQTICELVAQDKLLEPLYESPIGPIYPIDILFGNRKQISAGKKFMAKKVGFTYSVLNKALGEAGFQARYGGRMSNSGGELAIVAFKQRKSEEEIKKIADPLLF